MDEIVQVLPESFLAQLKIMEEREYAKNTKVNREDVRRVTEWIEKQPHLPNLSDIFAIIFLHRVNYSVELAKKRIDDFYTVKSLCPGIFAGRDANSPEMKEAIESLMIAPLPNQTPKGHKIIFLKLMDCDVRKYNFTNQIKHFDMLIWSFMVQTEGTNDGYVLVVDQKDATYEHLARSNLMVVKQLAYYVQKTVPVRIHQIHLINPFPFVDKMMSLMNLFFGSKLLKKIHIHNNINSLYEHVPQILLPKEWGGEAGTLEQLHENHKQLIASCADLLKVDEKLKADTSKKVVETKTFNDYFGVEGTFKNLQVD